MEDSNLLLDDSQEESKDISPLKKNANDDSLFSMANDALQEAKAQEEESKDQRKSETLNPMEKLARRKTVNQDKTMPHITNLHEDECR